MRRIVEVAGRGFGPPSPRVCRGSARACNDPARLQRDEADPAVGDPSVLGRTPSLIVHSDDGRPFSEQEGQLIDEILDVIRLADSTETRLHALEERAGALQRENLDLVMK